MAFWHRAHSDKCIFQLLIPGLTPVSQLESESKLEIATQLADTGKRPCSTLLSTVFTQSFRKALWWHVRWRQKFIQFIEINISEKYSRCIRRFHSSLSTCRHPVATSSWNLKEKKTFSSLQISQNNNNNQDSSRKNGLSLISILQERTVYINWRKHLSSRMVEGGRGRRRKGVPTLQLYWTVKQLINESIWHWRVESISWLIATTTKRRTGWVGGGGATINEQVTQRGRRSSINTTRSTPQLSMNKRRPSIWAILQNAPWWTLENKKVAECDR